MVLYKNDLICVFMNINENLKNSVKPLHNLVPQGVIRPKVNSWEHLLLITSGSMGHLKAKYYVPQ